MKGNRKKIGENVTNWRQVFKKINRAQPIFSKLMKYRATPCFLKKKEKTRNFLKLMKTRENTDFSYI